MAQFLWFTCLVAFVPQFGAFGQSVLIQSGTLSTNVSANNSIFFTTPDTLFRLPPMLFLASGLNATSLITVTTQEATLSWAGQSFAPGGPLDPPDLARAAATWQSTSRSEISRVRGFVNQTWVNYSVTESSNGNLLYTSMPYRRVCFTARVGPSSIILCYRIYVSLKPMPVTTCTYTASLNYYLPQGVGCPYKALQPNTVIAVGQKFEAWIYFQDMNRDGTNACTNCDKVSIALLSDPGLPNEAKLEVTSGGPGTPDTFPSDQPTNLLYLKPASQAANSLNLASFQQIYLYSRKLTFTPLATQILTYSICVRATSTSAWAALQSFPTPPTEQCYTITVAPPSIRVDPARTDFSPETVPALSPTPWPLRVGCTYVFSIALYEERDFGAVLDGFAPDPASAPAAGYRQGAYRPVAVVDPDTPLPAGAALSDPETVPVCESRAADCTPAAGPGPAYAVQRQTLTWTPPRGWENRTVRVCLRLREAAVAAGAATRCVDWRVAACQVCPRRGDTLASLARAYGADWLQLWGANPAITNPNGLALPSVLALGPLYVNSVEQPPALLAKLFAMELPALLAVNPALHPDRHVPAGAAVCIMSAVCT